MIILVSFTMNPLLDVVFDSEDYNPTSKETKLLSRAPIYLLHTWCWFPVHLAALAYSAYYICLGSSGTLLEISGVLASLTLIAGTGGFLIAHELIHRQSKWEKGLGIAILSLVCYSHWSVEHVKGHHKNVATPNDPASARRGDNVYLFALKAMIGETKGSWHLEVQRQQRQSPSVAPYSLTWWLNNHFVHFQLLHLAVISVGVFFFGLLFVPLYLCQSFGAIFLLEIINFTEHYGLERKEISPGLYEPVGSQHSWNANTCMTNYLLMKLQRHTDHHMHPSRRFQCLRHLPDAPQLPTGYTGMVILSLIPPLYRYVMDPRVLALSSSK